jgi:hypothetical protein
MATASRHHRRRVRTLTPERLCRELAAYERRYGLPSAEFYARFLRGELPHRWEFSAWAGLCYLAVAEGVLQPPEGVASVAP